MHNNLSFHKLLKAESLEQIVVYAVKTIGETGIATSNTRLLELASGKGLNVKNNRIYPSQTQIEQTLRHLQSNKLPDDHAFGRYHSWPDSMVKRPGNGELFIRVNDRATCFANHRNRIFRPLTRKDAIEGTKLIHSLNQKYGVAGYSCGTPQESHELINGIEQYLIGFRYNQFGGNTEVPSNSDLFGHFLDIREIAEENFDRTKPDISIWSASPMIIDSDEMNLFFEPGCEIKRVLIGTMPIMGLTGPVDPVGILTLALAETLGGATVIRSLFPETECFIMPHPQAMDLNSGLLSFGTVEHFRLELLKTELFDFLGLSYGMVKDTLTSSQMPDQLCQADKLLNITSSVNHGWNAFCITPLGCDEGWSSEQCLMDIEHIRNAWNLHGTVNDQGKAENAFQNIIKSVSENQLFATMDDTIINLFEHYRTDSIFKRTFSYQKWQEQNFPESLKNIEDMVVSLIENHTYHPPHQKWKDILTVYNKICKNMNVPAYNFEYA